MANSLRRVVILLLLLVTGLSANTKTQRGPTHLVLVVTFIAGRDPAFQNVPWADPNNRGSWYAGFVPLAKMVADQNGQAETGTKVSGATAEGVKAVEPVQAVRIVPIVDGEGASVRVWTMYGEKYFDKELPVSSFHIGIDESVEIKELRQFGVQPFVVRLARVVPSNQNLPVAVSDAPSIAPLTVEPNDSTLPSVTVKLRNLSYKNIVAMGVTAYSNGKVRLTGMPRGHEGHDLIEAGQTWDLNERIAQIAQKDGKGFIPISAPDQKIVITAVLFRDGTFEGDVETAAHGAAYQLGEKLMLEKLLPIFDEAMASDEGRTELVIQSMKEQIERLIPNVDQQTTVALASKFKGLTAEKAAGLKEVIDIGSAGLKSDLLKSIDRGLEGNKIRKTTESFHSILKQIRDGMAEWHDRL